MDTGLLSGISRAGSFAELGKVIEANTCRLGFRYFLFCGSFSAVPRDEGEIYFDNCPEPWHLYYRGRPIGTDEHAFFLGLDETREVAPTLWRELAKRAPAIFAEARKFGLVTGSTHRVHGPERQWSILSFIKDRAGADVELEVEARLADCHLIAAYVHDAAARLTGRSPCGETAPWPPPPRRVLNRRETQVLVLAAAGQTSARIAQTLAISPRTVVFHLSNARHKLGAVNSRHAVSRALSLGLIPLNGERPAHGQSGPGRGY